MISFILPALCFADAEPGIPFQLDPFMVVLSYLVVAAGSYAGLEMFERWQNAEGSQRRYWHLASAVTLGGSIWSMHFIAMLGIKIDLPLTYVLGIKLLSLLIAIGSVGLGLAIVGVGRRIAWARLCAAGPIMGLGIAGMHYVGMAGLSFPGGLAYTRGLWSLSLLAGILAATLALWLAKIVRETWQRGAASLVMGGALCSIHYVGMAATVFHFDRLVVVAPGLTSAPLASAVALTTAALIVCALIFVASDRRFLAAASREAEILRQSNDRLGQANRELERARQQLDAALSNMSQGLTFFDGEQKLIVCNRRYREIYRLTADETRPGTSLSDILNTRRAHGTFPGMAPEDFLARRAALSRDGQPYDLTDEFPDGRVVSMHYEPMPSDGWVATHEDITERRRTEANIAFMARHDALTRLPNRLLFHERLGQALAVSGSRLAILCLDLDHFKLVNDTLGHPIGDALLQVAADRLLTCVRDTDTVARLGGDEFAIIQRDVAHPGEVEQLANRIIAAISTPCVIDGHQILAGTSIGVAMAPDDGSSADKLLKNADIALYLAKAEGRGTVRFFEPEMDAHIQLRRGLELDLRTAIVRQEFELVYQPQADIATDRVIGFEALLRWHHPVRGLVLPAAFISIAEETGLIVAIGEWVLQVACREATSWPSGVRVAVNLSSVQFRIHGIVAAVKAALDASGLPASRLELEITESALLSDTAATLAALHQLREMGIAIALDDFGTGYSSLSYLRSFPFDKIKIDQSFVRDLANDNEAMSIVRAITALGHSLNMKTIAEGVETAEQLDMLRKEGCSEIQGFLLSAPVPAHDLPALIQSLHRLDQRAL